jgi:hypothetical protein
VGDTIGKEDEVADVFAAQGRIMMVSDSIDDAFGQIPVFGNVPTETGVADSKNPRLGFDTTNPFGNTKLGNSVKNRIVDEVPQDELANVVQERRGEHLR